MNLSRRVVYILLIFVSVAAYAEDSSFQSSYDSGKELAKNKHGSVLSSLQNFKPEAVFNGFTSQPNESKHYGGVQQSVDTLKSPIVVSEETQNPVAKTLRDNFGSRPQYKVDASADSIKNSQWMIDHANEVTRGKSCKKIPACETTYESKTCQEEASLRWYYCQKTLNVKVNNQVHESHYPITVHLDSDRYYVGANIDVFSGRIIDHGPHDSKVWIDGRLPANIDCNTLQSTITSSTINKKYIDGIHYPACGDLSLTIHVTLPKNSKVSGKVVIDIVSRRVDTTIDEGWEDGCTKYASDSQCKLELDQCTQGKETRVIGGESITRDCWAKNCATHVKLM